MQKNHCQYARDFLAHCRPVPSDLETGLDFAWVCCLPADFVGFAGHFPGRPILPAFVQVVACQALLEEHLGRSLELVRISRSKFSEPVLPDQSVTISGSVSLADGGVSARLRFVENDRVHSAIRIECRDAGPSDSRC